MKLAEETTALTGNPEDPPVVVHAFAETIES